MKSMSIRLVALCVCLLASLCWCWGQKASSQPASASAPSATSLPVPQLAKYFGFGDMEVLKLETGLGRPVIVDINGDGLNDILLTNNAKSRIELLLQRRDRAADAVNDEIDPDDCNNIFGRECLWRFKRVKYDLDVAVAALAVADVNNDGLPDLIYYSKQGLYVALQQKPSAASQPAVLAEEPPAAKAKPSKAKAKADAAKAELVKAEAVKAEATKSTVASQPTTCPADPSTPLWQPAKKIDLTEGQAFDRALAVGDLNGDGRCDIALLGNNAVFILLQKPDGTFSQSVKYPSSGQRLRQIDIADVDGDARNDLVLLTADDEYPIRVRFQDGQGKLGPEVRYEIPNPTVMELAPLGKGTQKAFVTVAGGSGRLAMYALGKASEQGTFPVLNYPLPASDAAGDRDATAADVDGDGLLDVVVSDPATAEFLLFRGQDAQGLGTPESFPGMLDMRKLCPVKLDGSGKDAIIALSLKEKLIGISRYEQGRLSYPQAITVTGEPEAMAVADIDGDGKADLLYVAKDKAGAGKGKSASGPAESSEKSEKADKSGDKRFLRTVLKVGTPEAQNGPELELTELKDKPQDLRACDIDHDGRCDIMVMPSYGALQLIRQGEDGKFTLVTGKDIHAGLVSELTPGGMCDAPLGKDGSCALLLSQKSFARSLFFDAKNGWTVIDQYPPADPRGKITAAAACCLGNPGSTATSSPSSNVSVVLYDNARGKLSILGRKDDGTYRPDREVDLGTLNVKKILSGHFGGPSVNSLIVCAVDELAMVPVSFDSRQMRKLASFETQIKGAHFGAIAFGDLNSDGVPEIALADQANNHIEVLTFNDQAKLVSGTRFKVFEAPRGQRSYEDRDQRTGEPRLIFIGDVTGKGRNDLILLVHDRIIIYPQDK